MENKKIDRRQLTNDQVAQLDTLEATNKQTDSLGQIQSVLEQVKILQALSMSGKPEEMADGFLKGIGSIKKLLESLDAKTQPDYAKPVVAAVSKLETALTSAVKSIELKPELKPNIKVAAPQVNVDAPVIDLSQVERVLRDDLPKAFAGAIKAIPKTEIPEPDQQPLLDKLGDILEQLASIDTATRMKPQPGSMKVTNSDGSRVFSTPTALVNGRTTVTTAGTRVRLSSNVVVAATLKALSTNTGLVYVGDATVSSANGFILSAGETLNLDIDNTNRLYIDSSVNAEGISFLGIV